MSDILDAALDGRIEDVKRIIKTKVGKVTETNDQGETALHLAVQNKNLELVKYLVENDADIDVQDKIGTTPLHTICLLSQTNAKNLQDDDTDEGEYYEEGKNPYHIIAKYLLEQGANPDVITSTDKRSPLMTACSILDEYLIEILIDHKADVNLLDNNGSSAMHRAANPAIYCHYLKKISVIELLMTCGGNVYYNAMHWTPRDYLGNEDMSCGEAFDTLVDKYHPQIIGADTHHNIL